MEDVPWLYVAMIFIAFVSWVYNQIKEAAAIRREKAEERRRAEHKREKRATSAEYRSPYRGNRQGDSAPTPPSRGSQTVPEGPKSFRDVFQELERQFQGMDSEAEAPTPPPLPSSSGSGYSAPEPPPQPQLPTEPIEVSPPLQVQSTRKKRSGRETTEVLTGVLRDQGRLRTALVLKEVLDRPRALRRR